MGGKHKNWSRGNLKISKTWSRQQRFADFIRANTLVFIVGFVQMIDFHGVGHSQGVWTAPCPQPDSPRAGVRLASRFVNVVIIRACLSPIGCQDLRNSLRNVADR